MKKLLIAILFVLIVIPVNAQSVREEKEYHSRASVMGLSGREDPFYGAKAKLSYLSDGTISLKGCGIADGIYSPYHSSSVYGVNFPSGCTVYHGPQYQINDHYLLVSNDEKCIRVLYFGYQGSYRGWNFMYYYEFIDEPLVSSPSPGYAPTPSPSPNYNSTTPSQGRTCAGCHGTGVCTMCQGKGGYYTNSGTYTGSGSKTWHQCSSCHGSGKCGVCYGKGVIR